MGDYNTFDDASLSKCDSLGLDVHLQAQATESWGERQGRERVQTPYRGIDVGKQVYALSILVVLVAEADISQSWMTILTQTRPGLKYPAYLSKRFMLWRLNF